MASCRRLVFGVGLVASVAAAPAAPAAAANDSAPGLGGAFPAVGTAPVGDKAPGFGGFIPNVGGFAPYLGGTSPVGGTSPFGGASPSFGGAGPGLAPNSKAVGGAVPAANGAQGGPATAEACRTVGELQKWYFDAVARVKASVPAGFQNFPLDHIKQDFVKRMDQLRQEGDKASASPDLAEPKLQQPPPAPVSAMGPGPQEKPPPPPPAAVGLNPEQDCARLTAHAFVGGEESMPAVTDLPVLLMTAEMCQTDAELDAWKACQLAEIENHVPPSYRHFSLGDVLRSSARRSAELAKVAAASDATEALALLRPHAVGTMPVFVAVATQCTTEDELRAWRAHQLSEVGRFPPKFRDFAAGAVNGAFEGRLQELRSLPKDAIGAARPWTVAAAETVQRPLAAEAPSLSGASPPTAAAAEAETLAAAGGEGSSWSTLLVVFVGLGTPAFLAFGANALRAQQTKAEPEATYVHLMPV